MNKRGMRALDLACEIVDYAMCTGYAADELMAAANIIDELLWSVAKIKKMASLVSDDDECEVDDETIENVIKEAEEAINDVD